MAIEIADTWFEWRRVDDDITLIWEPAVAPLLRCNIWHVRGNERDLLVDTGLGMASLRTAARELFDKPLTAVATHTHYDHVGGLHEFEDRIVHRAEAAIAAEGGATGWLFAAEFDDDLVRALNNAGYELPERLFTALPAADYDPHAYRVPPAPASRLVDEGDIVDIGRRRFEVLHLPGHSPGSIGLWEAASGTLFSGDAIYDGPLLYDTSDADLAAYVRTMERLRELPVRVVHGGHDPSFGRDRLLEIVDRYLALWQG